MIIKTGDVSGVIVLKDDSSVNEDRAKKALEAAKEDAKKTAKSDDKAEN